MYDDVTAACTNASRIQGFPNCPELYESMAWQPMLNGIITYEGAEVTIASGVSLFTGVEVVTATNVAISVSVFYVTVVPAMTNTLTSILVTMQTLGRPVHYRGHRGEYGRNINRGNIADDKLHGGHF